MSAVIFTESSIEAAGTPATGPFHYRPLTISPFRLMGFFISLFLSHGLCYRPFPAIDPLLSVYLSHGLCSRSFPVIDPLLPALFVAWARYWPFPTTGPLPPALFCVIGLASGRFYYRPLIIWALLIFFLLLRPRYLPILLPASNY